MDWIKEVNDIIQGLGMETNNYNLQVKIANEIIKILKTHKVEAFVDCSSRVNTSEVVQHGDFRALVETPNITYIFKYIGNKK